MSRTCSNDRLTAVSTLLLDEDMFWFRGHFPRQPILPGIAQVDWAIHLAREILEIEGTFIGVEQAKFQSPLQPGQTVELHLGWDPDRSALSFRYVVPQPHGLQTASSGKIKLCR